MAAVCEFCARDTISLLPDEATRNRFKHTYHVIGLLLVLSPAAALGASYLLQRYVSRTFFIAWFGVWVFAAYLLAKSAEFHVTSAEKRALKRELKKAPGIGLVPIQAADQQVPAKSIPGPETVRRRRGDEQAGQCQSSTLAASRHPASITRIPAPRPSLSPLSWKTRIDRGTSATCGEDHKQEVVWATQTLTFARC